MATNPFTDWTKMCGNFSDFKMPAFDASEAINHSRKAAEKAAEAASSIAQIATESAQAIGRNNLSIARANTEHLVKASKKGFNPSSPESAVAEHADFAKNWIEFNVNAVRENLEVSTKAMQEMSDVFNKYFAEQMKKFAETAGSVSQATTKKKAA